MTNFGKGTEKDGCTFSLDFDGEHFVVTVKSPSENMIAIKKYTPAFEPRFGHDVVDAERANVIVTKLLRMVRGY